MTEPDEKSQGTFPKVKHRHPMSRLKKGRRLREVRDFHAGVRASLVERFNFIVEPKICGVSIEMVYEKGILAMASTRGDGLVGEVITPNIKTILTVPLTLMQFPGGPPVPERLEVRGVVYVERDAFETLNRQRLEKGLSPFSSPFKATADSLRQLDHKITAKRPLNIFCYGIGGMTGPAFETHQELMIRLQEWGFRINRPQMRMCDSENAIILQCKFLKKTREQYPYQIEGAIIKVNQLNLQARLGQDARGPRWAFLYKFGADA